MEFTNQPSITQFIFTISLELQILTVQCWSKCTSKLISPKLCSSKKLLTLFFIILKFDIITLHALIIHQNLISATAFLKFQLKFMVAYVLLHFYLPPSGVPLPLQHSCREKVWRQIQKVWECMCLCINWAGIPWFVWQMCSKRKSQRGWNCINQT